MNKAGLIIGAIVLIIVVFLGLKYSGLYGTGSTQSTPPSNIVVPANSVVIQGNSFNPATLNVKVGQKITWINNDSYDHTITSDTGAFDSGRIAAGQSYSFTFSKEGTYNYHCSIHTFMTAKIVVTK